MLELEWRPVALAGFLQLAASLALAVLVFITRPDRSQNRWLASFLLFAGLWHGSVEGVRMLFTDPREVHAIGVVLYALLPWLAFTYLGFLSTLQTGIVAPLRHPLARSVLLASAAGLTVTALVRTEWWYEGQIPWRHVGGIQYDTAVLANAFYPFLFVAYAYGLVAAVGAYAAAEGDLARRKMKWYLAGFAVHDTLQAVWTYLLIFHINPKTANSLIEHTYFILPAGAALALGVLLSYGVLQAQLFDIDVKLKWTLRRGTVIGSFIAVFVVVAAVVEQWLQQYGVIVGGVAVGLLLLAIRPLERAADRLADRAMPGVAATPQYLTFRKLEIYKGAVEGAARDGEITPKERDILTRLRRDLGIAEGDASAVEADALRRDGEAN